MYVELHAASAFSFLRASSAPEDLVARAAELGYKALALVDRDGLSGAPRFFKAAKAAGLRPLVGAALTGKFCHKMRRYKLADLSQQRKVPAIRLYIGFWVHTLSCDR